MLPHVLYTTADPAASLPNLSRITVDPGCPPKTASSSSSRRHSLLLIPTTAAALLLAPPPPSASASRLPEAADRAWEAMGGGPADITYPESFLGTWDVESVLVSVDLPQGAEYVPDMTVVQRAQQQDQGKIVKYSALFVRNPRGQVVTDRRFNTASLVRTYTGKDVTSRITWDIGDPGRLEMSLPGGYEVTTRVTRRMEEMDADAARLETSEFFEQIIESEQAQSPKVKASQAYTKYHWRTADVAQGGPEIVATQVVSDYVAPAMGDDPRVLLSRTSGKPVTIYTYRMAFIRQLDGSSNGNGNSGAVDIS